MVPFCVSTPLSLLRWSPSPFPCPSGSWSLYNVYTQPLPVFHTHSIFPYGLFLEPNFTSCTLLEYVQLCTKSFWKHLDQNNQHEIRCDLRNDDNCLLPNPGKINFQNIFKEIPLYPLPPPWNNILMFMWKLWEELPSEFRCSWPKHYPVCPTFLFAVVFMSSIYLCTVCHWGCWATNSYILASYLQELWSPSVSPLPSLSCVGCPPPFPAPLEADPRTFAHMQFIYSLLVSLQHLLYSILRTRMKTKVHSIPILLWVHQLTYSHLLRHKYKIIHEKKENLVKITPGK